MIKWSRFDYFLFVQTFYDCFDRVFRSHATDLIFFSNYHTVRCQLDFLLLIILHLTELRSEVFWDVEGFTAHFLRILNFIIVFLAVNVVLGLL